MTLIIEKLVFGGQGMARDNGRAVFVWNALPGEEVEVEYVNKKKDYAEAVAVNIISPSSERIIPPEKNYLSASPWQMMSFEAETKYKQQIAVGTYERNGGLILQNNPPEIVSDSANFFGYRNKIEFSFYDDAGSISLAFFGRGSRFRHPVQGSLLAEPIINEVAVEILQWINEVKIPIRSLKSLIIRSNGAGKAIAGLFIKDKLVFDHFPKLSTDFLGFFLYYSTHKSPASVPTELLYSAGQDSLIADIAGTPLRYGLFSFFQINIPIFSQTVKDIAAFIGPKNPILDFYSGVGAISLPLARNRTKTTLVEMNEDSIRYANKNIRENSIANAAAYCMPAEKMTDIIDGESIVIVDPPRAGLHNAVIARLLAKKPPKIVYLACDLSTQARDVSQLSEKYTPIFIKLYNFFPRTPHIEGLIILERND